nr:hypothetical protein [Comamonas jiangduensis]
MRADTFPMGQADKFDQPPPRKPLLGSDNYLRSHDVLPVAKADIREPLPPAVPLPAATAQQEVLQPQDSTAQPSEEQGGGDTCSRHGCGDYECPGRWRAAQA